MTTDLRMVCTIKWDPISKIKESITELAMVIRIRTGQTNAQQTEGTKTHDVIVEAEGDTPQHWAYRQQHQEAELEPRIDKETVRYWCPANLNYSEKPGSDGRGAAVSSSQHSSVSSPVLTRSRADPCVCLQYESIQPWKVHSMGTGWKRMDGGNCSVVNFATRQ